MNNLKFYWKVLKKFHMLRKSNQRAIENYWKPIAKYLSCKQD